MEKIVILLSLLAVAAADPLVFASPYLASPFTAAYASPYAAAYASPYAAAYSSPYAAPYTSAALVAPAGPAVPAAVPAAATVPLSSVSAYSYGSSYSIQDYAGLVNTAAPLYSSAYSLPYSYGDWFYRR